MAQTAVDFFVSEFSKTSYKDIKELISKAKELEKKNIVNAWDLGRRDIDYPANGEDYYNKFFNNNDTETI